MLPTRVLRAARGPKASITGFNMRAFKEAAGQPRYDPWERAEAWRYTGTFSRWNRFRGTLPGLGTATVAFAGYCVYEHFFLDDGHHHGEEQHH
ncbi:NADH-ubiquinone oxidoreductase B12 subunit family protein [Tolypocladium paradoxum]|uniref:NADH-ubiquinone oxidoreductase B12 subunit family protein n=1 Tax=Tolypocladium paradoxum TaxID=94208 RepID=A0A2S4KPM7_9HYPO|nr:NADH-ubiquinone oxidoreductase B12 subunit family protein [Tolypocladium paradoxum]